MTSDAYRGTIVLFGGDSNGTKLGDTWLWDGTTWNDPSPRFPPLASSPSARSGHAMAYDSRRRKVVLFGGDDGQSSPPVLFDTWEWDGASWTQVVPAGLSPFARREHAMTFDPVAGVTILFGGYNGTGTYYGDTWTWDGTTWAQVTPPQPTPPQRSGHAMAYDPLRSQVILFGGMDGNGPRNDTWLWNGTNWMSGAPTTIPAARQGHAMGYDHSCQGVILAGGGIDRWNPLFPDTWQWNGVTWVQRLASNPQGALWWSSAAYDPASGRLLLFEGKNAQFPSGIGTWHWTCGSWTPIHRSVAPPHEREAMVYDTARQRVVMYEASGSNNSSTWEWDGSHWTQRFPVTSPTPPRPDHAMAYDIRRRLTVLFGGGSWWTGGFADTWAWDGSNWSLQTPQASPGARWLHAMAYDAARERVVLFGGDSQAGRLQDTWTWNGTIWIQHPAGNPPPARSGHALAYDAARREVVLFGGENGATLFTDTWTWDGTTWTPRQPSASPTVRRFHAMAYDNSRRTVVLFGGDDPAGQLQDAWEWNGTNWAQVPTSRLQPGVRRDPALAYDTARQRVILYGGWNQTNPWSNTLFFDTWELVPSSLTVTPPAQRPGNLLFNLNIPGDAGSAFIIALSFGTVPGIPIQHPVLGAVVLPLNPDGLFYLSFLMGLQGTLDNNGSASVAFFLSDSPLLAGLAAYAGALTYGPPIRTITPEAFFRLR